MTTTVGVIPSREALPVGFIRPAITAAEKDRCRWVFIDFYEGRNPDLNWQPVYVSNGAQGTLTDEQHAAAAKRSACWKTCTTHQTCGQYGCGNAGVRLGREPDAALTPTIMGDPGADFSAAADGVDSSRAPLSDDRIRAIANDSGMFNDSYEDFPGSHCERFARAIERELQGNAGVMGEENNRG
jgi:hypothetical protein